MYLYITEISSQTPINWEMLQKLNSINMIMLKRKIKFDPIKRYTLEIVILRAYLVHGNKYNYNLITLEHIHNKLSKIPIICNTCDYQWNSSIYNHINRGHGCLECANQVPWSLERFIRKGTEIHGDKYDYHQITPEHIKGYKSKVPIICRLCNNNWNQRISVHITCKCGCPKCHRSHGEIVCENHLNSLSIYPESQHILDNLPRKRFDFRFTYNNRNFLLEFDGSQHFKYVPYFHQDVNEFIRKQQVDVLKTQRGLEKGYSIIRIDYTQINNLNLHINNAFNSTSTLYFSDHTIYQYIINGLSQ